MSRVRRRRFEFADLDPLGRAIQLAIDELLAEGLISRRYADDPSTAGGDRYNGFCARAVQSYWRFTRDPEFRHLATNPDVEPYRYDDGESVHYWIRVNGSGKILDLNIGPGEAPDHRYRYDRGKRRPTFQPRPAGSNIPHNNDARLIMERVRRNERRAASDVAT